MAMGGLALVVEALDDLDVRFGAKEEVEVGHERAPARLGVSAAGKEGRARNVLEVSAPPGQAIRFRGVLPAGHPLRPARAKVCLASVAQYDATRMVRKDFVIERHQP